MGKKKDRKKDRKKADRGSNPATAEAAEAPRGKLSKKEYESALLDLQVELCRLQTWVKATGAKIVVLFEGRDTAGKGGVIKRIMERVSPRVFHVVALGTPSDREKTQLYYQRYIPHLPAAGEVMLFDRSWYNRAGVEKVMGFCTDEEYGEFMRTCPGFEFALVQSGAILLKYWLEVDQDTQLDRFRSRIEDPTKHWKLSPMDLESVKRYYDYSRAADAMFAATHTEWAPWYVVDANDQKRARLNCISHMLSKIPYEHIPWEKPKLPRKQRQGSYEAPPHRFARVPEQW